ncbi:hypothetical protein YC2023_077713 [Brassica napus]
METEAGTWNRKRMEAQKRDFKKERNGYALEAYPYNESVIQKRNRENILEAFWKRDYVSFHKVPISIPVPKWEADVR